MKQQEYKEASRAAKSWENTMRVGKVETQRLGATEMRMLYQSVLEKETIDIDDLDAHMLVVCTYGDPNGTPLALGQGSTPGMLRTLQIVVPKVPGAEHLMLANRLEMCGESVHLAHNYIITSLKEFRPITTSELKTILKDAKSFVMEKGGSATTSPLVTPRGSESHVTSGTGSVGSGEEVLNVADKCIISGTGSVGSGEEVVLNDAGKRVFGGAAKAVLAKRARVAAEAAMQS